MINALNIKRGYWRLPRPLHGAPQPAGISPFGSTPETAGTAGGSTSGASNAAPSATVYGQVPTRPGSANELNGAMADGSPGNQGMMPKAADTTSVPSPWTVDKFPWIPDFEQAKQQQQQAHQAQQQQAQQQQAQQPQQVYPPVGSLRAQERGGGSHSAF